MTQHLCQELDKVGGLDEGDEGSELGVEGEEVEDGARLPCARVQRHRKVEGSPAHHGQDAVILILTSGLVTICTILLSIQQNEGPSGECLSFQIAHFCLMLVMSRCFT